MPRPGTQTARFITPDADVTLPFHCHVAAHDKVGMLGELIVGKGGPAPRALAAKGVKGAAKVFDAVGSVVAVLPREGRLIVKHDEIKGYMAAMEMSFVIAKPELLQGLGAGDKIGFKLDAATSTIVELRVLDRVRYARRPAR